MADRLYQTTIIPAAEVSPDTLTQGLVGIIQHLENGFEDRGLAADWNNLQINVGTIPEGAKFGVGDFKIAAAAPVL